MLEFVIEYSRSIVTGISTQRGDDTGESAQDKWNGHAREESQEREWDRHLTRAVEQPRGREGQREGAERVKIKEQIQDVPPN